MCGHQRATAAYRARAAAAAGAVPEQAAARLFAERARLAAPDLDLAEQHETVTAICERLDGMPLAIELAAARVAALAPSELLARLGHTLALLARGPRDLAERHRSLRAALEWTHELPSPPSARCSRAGRIRRTRPARRHRSRRRGSRRPRSRRRRRRAQRPDRRLVGAPPRRSRPWRPLHRPPGRARLRRRAAHRIRRGTRGPLRARRPPRRARRGMPRRRPGRRAGARVRARCRAATRARVDPRDATSCMRGLPSRLASR